MGQRGIVVGAKAFGGRVVDDEGVFCRNDAVVIRRVARQDDVINLWECLELGNKTANHMAVGMTDYRDSNQSNRPIRPTQPCTPPFTIILKCCHRGLANSV